MSRRLYWAIFCMAVFLTGTVAMSLVATQNFYTVDRLLAHSPNDSFKQAIDRLDPDGRDLLRYLSSELNRLYFQWWNGAQLAVIALSLWLVWPIAGKRRARWCILAMLGVTLFLALALTPYIVSVGRQIDFVPRNPPPSWAVAPLRTFGLLHGSFAVFTLIDLILGALVTWWLQEPDE